MAAPVLNNQRRLDPSRTGGLRRRFQRDVDRRLAVLKRDLKTSIVTNDCFGLVPISRRYALTALPERAFFFDRDPEKIAKFMAWLLEQERLGILEIVSRPGTNTAIEGAWTDIYIQSAYAQGIRRAQAEMLKAGIPAPQLNLPLGNNSEVSLRLAFNQPIHADRVGVIYTRAYEDLKSVADVMNARIRRSIADGLTTGLARGISEGKSPEVIARELMKDVAHHVDVIGRTRARMIARTEVMRAHHVANINEYRRADAAMEVEVMAEWSIADLTACTACQEMAARDNGHGKGVYTLDEIEGLIPYHPQCRCVAVPHIVRQTANTRGRRAALRRAA